MDRVTIVRDDSIDRPPAESTGGRHAEENWRFWVVPGVIVISMLVIGYTIGTQRLHGPMGAVLGIGSVLFLGLLAYKEGKG